MTTTALILKDTTFGAPVIAPSALQAKADALALAKPIKKVETPEEQQAAVVALQGLKAIRHGMEATRKAVKAPVLELGKKIDALAADFLHECDREAMRLQGHINHFQKKAT